jgi:pilus assembly protein Flp/PilA
MLNYLVALVSTFAQRLGRDDRGATAVEYGLMVALIAAVIIGAVTLLGGNLNTLFTNVANTI